MIGDSTTIGNGNVIGHNIEGVTIIQGNTVTYEGDKEKNIFTQKYAPVLIKKYGRQNIGLVGIVSFLSGIITIFTGIISVTKSNIIPFIPHIDILNPYWMVVSFFLIIIGAWFLNVRSYYDMSQCKECKQEFAYIESREPKIKEDKILEGTRIKITRYYKCKYCGHEDMRVVKKTVQSDKTVY